METLMEKQTIDSLRVVLGDSSDSRQYPHRESSPSILEHQPIDVIVFAAGDRSLRVFALQGFTEMVSLYSFHPSTSDEVICPSSDGLG